MAEAQTPTTQQQRKPTEPPAPPTAERIGSRWAFAPPSEEQVREWFNGQPLHVGMEHAPYLGGIVVIGAKEKYNLTRVKANGDPFTAEVERATYTPYVKVDTRIAYFHDLVRALNEGVVESELEASEVARDARLRLRAQLTGPYAAIIRAVPQKTITDAASFAFNANLPEGFAVTAVTNKDKSVSRYLIATWEVAIVERESWITRVKGEPPLPLLRGVASKQVPLLRNYADDNAIMKAETGAIGRALGVAGILVVGTGVATAEDMQEAQVPSGVSGGAPAALPPVVNREGEVQGEATSAAAPVADQPPAANSAADEGASDETRRERAMALQGELEEQFPEVWEAYKAWWNGRELGPLSALSGPALRGAVIKLERDLDDARRAAAATVAEPSDPAPAAEPELPAAPPTADPPEAA